MKKILIAFCCSMLLLTSFACYSAREPVIKDIQGQTYQRSTLKGKWVFVNYWAPWCHTCLGEMPAFNRFYKHNSAKNVVVLGVNYDPSGPLEDSVKRAGIKFPVLTKDPNYAWKLGLIEAVPTTFIMNPKGEVVKTLVGGYSDEMLTEILHDLQRV